MSENNKAAERAVLRKVLRIYKSLPCLWKVKSSDYQDRNAKKIAYEQVLDVYREGYPDATMGDLKKRINSLRTNFRKQLRRIDAFENSGFDDNYESKLWCFNDLLFLQNQETTDTSFISLDDEEDPLKIPDSPPTIAIAPQKKKPKISQSFVMKVASKDKDPVDVGNKNEEIAPIALLVSQEIKKMKPDQQALAQKFISDILFEGNMGALHRNWYGVNGPRAITNTDKTNNY